MLHAPVAFGAEVRIARDAERLVAFLRFGSMAVLAQGVAIVRRRAPATWLAPSRLPRKHSTHAPWLARFTCPIPPGLWPVRAARRKAASCNPPLTWRPSDTSGYRSFAPSSSFFSSSARLAGSLAAFCAAPSRRRTKFVASKPSPLSAEAARTASFLPVSSITACSVARRFCDS